MKNILSVAFLAVTIVALRAETNSNPTPSVDEQKIQVQDDFSMFIQAHRSNSPTQANLAASLYAEMSDFCVKHPAEKITPRIFAVSIQIGDMMVSNQWPGGPSSEDLAKKMASLDKIQQAGVRFSELAEALHDAWQTPDAGDKWDAVDGQIDCFDKEFGPDFAARAGAAPFSVRVRKMELAMLALVPGRERYNALLKKMSGSSDQVMVDMASEAAKEQQIQDDLMSKPLDLKFTAVDGTAVDISQMRGKVVLIDFWATWCGPCVGEMPNVIAAYKKYHDQGFEIVGISLDQEKTALLSFIKSHGMPWPQFFDGKGWENEIAKRFSIHQVPTMWLVGKDGKVITTDAMGMSAVNGTDPLDENIEKALQTK